MLARLSLLLALANQVASPGLVALPVKPQACLLDPIARELNRVHGVGADQVSLINAALTNPDPEARWMAIDLLGRCRHHTAETVLRVVLRDDMSALVREEAALALVRLGKRDVLADARKLLMTAELAGHRVYLAGQLAVLGDFYGYGFVISAATSEDQYMRSDSAGALAAFLAAGFSPSDDRPHPRDLLVRLLNDTSSRVREEAIWRVAALSTKEELITPFLDMISRMAEEDPDQKVRKTARLQLVSWEATRGLRESNR